MPNKIIEIETREHLLSTLAEASELEHGLMCMYLYSVFSLKMATDEGLTEAEIKLVEGWRKVILGICIEEMGHLALVSNITTSLGGSVHLLRPDFPVRSGLFPSDFVLELAPFDQDTLKHFIFLERPEDAQIRDSSEFSSESDKARASFVGRLMTSVGQYSTVGELYSAIEAGISRLCDEIGESNLFCGPIALQLGPDDIKLAGLNTITGRHSALRAIQLIVEQGEGARSEKGSHFEKFKKIESEFNKAISDNPNFRPARPAARNPLMRKPIAPGKEIWIEEARAAQVLDFANALYSLMLRFLLQVYSMEGRDPKSRKTMVENTFALMHALGTAAAYLTTLPASSNVPGINAGITFALNRHFSPIELSSERRLLLERTSQMLKVVSELNADELDSIEIVLKNIQNSLTPDPGEK